MDIAHQFQVMPSLVRSYDGVIIAAYAAFAATVLLAIYLGSGGPGFGDADLSMMAMMP